MSVRVFLEELNKKGKIYPDHDWCCLMSRTPKLNEKKKKIREPNTFVHCFLFPVGEHSVTNCLMLLVALPSPPWWTVPPLNCKPMWTLPALNNFWYSCPLVLLSSLKGMSRSADGLRVHTVCFHNEAFFFF